MISLLNCENEEIAYHGLSVSYLYVITSLSKSYAVSKLFILRFLLRTHMHVHQKLLTGTKRINGSKANEIRQYIILKHAKIISDLLPR